MYGLDRVLGVRELAGSLQRLSMCLNTDTIRSCKLDCDITNLSMLQA